MKAIKAAWVIVSADDVRRRAAVIIDGACVADVVPWELRRDIRDDRVLIFSKKFKAQSGKVVCTHYAVRVVSAGEFILPGTSVEAMYAPEIRAHERARRVKVAR